MKIFCLEDFKSQIEQLKRKKSYREIEKIIVEYFFDKTVEALKSGHCLNNNHIIPYIKKRLDGSGGYRVYYLLKTKEEELYLMFIYPKTGPFGSPNLTDDAKTELYKDVLRAINENDLYSVEHTEDKTTIIFKKNTPKLASRSEKPIK